VVLVFGGFAISEWLSYDASPEIRRVRVKNERILTKEEAKTLGTTQSKAWQLWYANRAQFGDTLEARVKTADAIKALPGVADAGVSADHHSVWIRYTSGVEASLP
jgi:hypothetical protein